MGMKREAVQEERQRTKERDQSEVESTSSLHSDMPIERILEAEKRVECKMEQQGNYEVNMWEEKDSIISYLFIYFGSPFSHTRLVKSVFLLFSLGLLICCNGYDREDSVGQCTAVSRDEINLFVIGPGRVIKLNSFETSISKGGIKIKKKKKRKESIESCMFL